MPELINGVYYKSPAFKVGDHVTVVYQGYSSPFLKAGTTHIVESVQRAYSHGDTFYDKANDRYQYIFDQKIKVYGHGNYMSSKNFVLTKENTMQMLESKRPTLVREFREVTGEDGKAVREYVGDYRQFDSTSDARIFTTNEITNSIRKDNTYRKFAIFVETAVAQAKEPEIEFK